MNRYHLISLLVGSFLVSCAMPDRVAPRVRSVKSWEASSFHRTVELTVGWVPYTERIMKEGIEGEWNVLPIDSGSTDGQMPVLVLTYPDSGQSIILDLHMDDALLGNLLKHSLMTEVPIRRPFSDYLQEANCAKCHPADVRIPGIN